VFGILIGKEVSVHIHALRRFVSKRYNRARGRSDTKSWPVKVWLRRRIVILKIDPKKEGKYRARQGDNII